VAKALPKVRPKKVEIGVFKGHGAAFYSVPGVITAHRIRARFGRFGRISVFFHRRKTRQLLKPPKPCRGGIVERTGGFSGTIRFRGEDDYTRVNADRAPGRVDLVHRLHCPQRTRHAKAYPPDVSVIAKSQHSFLIAGTLGRDRSLSLATTREAFGRVDVGRIIVEAPGRDSFTFDPDLTSAHVNLPAPFAGSADFTAPHAWTGTLTASFPGAPDVPMAGPAFRARLEVDRGQGLPAPTGGPRFPTPSRLMGATHP
jgi:hypothetical protein